MQLDVEMYYRSLSGTGSPQAAHEMWVMCF